MYGIFTTFKISIFPSFLAFNLIKIFMLTNSSCNIFFCLKIWYRKQKCITYKYNLTFKLAFLIITDTEYAVLRAVWRKSVKRSVTIKVQKSAISWLGADNNGRRPTKTESVTSKTRGQQKVWLAGVRLPPPPPHPLLLTSPHVWATISWPIQPPDWPLVNKHRPVN